MGRLRGVPGGPSANGQTEKPGYCVRRWGAGLFFAALLFASLSQPADALIVVINELMYHPSRAQGDYEYIELYNDTTIPVDLGGWHFSAGLKYTFPQNAWIPAHGYLVVASSPTVVLAHNGAALVVGPYTGKLDNAGEKVELSNPCGGVMDSVTYKDKEPWPVAADGSGHSLSLIHPYYDREDAESWAASLAIGGTPGAANFPTPPPAPSVVISELQSNPPVMQPGWIEVHNVTTGPITLSGWYLSDDNNQLNKYPIAGTVLPQDGYAYFTAVTMGFPLNPSSGTVFLTNPGLTRVVDACTYRFTAPGHSRGRYFDQRNHKEHWYYVTNPTPGLPNTVTINDGVVINEIMYNPFPGRRDREYIELYNRTGSPIPLTAWRLTDDIQFDFAPGTTIAAGAYLVVAESTATITSVYGLPVSQVLGNFRGHLGNAGGHIVLRDNYGNIADEVAYHDGGRWPEWANGRGSSLELIDPNQSNDYPSAWAAGDDSSKAQWTFVQYTKQQRPSTDSFENEFHMMLTDDGAALIDDLHMTAAGGGPELVTNGDFEAGTAGWTIGGTHKYSTAVTGAGNVHGGTQALKIVAVGRGTEGTDHIERDTAAPLVASANYTISYWARWVVGCNQLLTRTQFHGVAQTTPLPVPERLGTPGQRNSRWQANLGPIISHVHHAPVVPIAGTAVTVTALILDSNGTANATLYYKTDLAAAWSSVPMADDGLHGDGKAGDDVWGGIIPGQADNTLMEFYIRAQDTLGAWLTFPASDPPANPPPKRALYQVRNAPRTTTLKSFQLLLNDDVVAKLQSHTGYNLMDNELLDATFVLDDKWAFYNVQFRFKGSAYTRPAGLAARPAYRIRFNRDEPLFGIVAVNLDNNDASGNDSRMTDEMVNYLQEKLGGIPITSHEYVRMYRFATNDGTRDRNQGVYDHVKRIDGGLLDDYYPNANDGFLHKVDDHFEWNDSGGFTRRTSETAHLAYQGPDEENHRWTFKPRTRELEDDFTSLIALTQFMDPRITNDATFIANADRFLEPNEWLRKWAVSALCDDWDTLGMDGGPRGKNCYIYRRADSGRWVLIPWDSDLTLANAQRAIFPADPWFSTERRFQQVPIFQRRYLRYLKRLVDGPFATAPWNAQIDLIWNNIFTVEGDYKTTSPWRLRTYQVNRTNWLRANVLPAPVPFAITTNGGLDFAVDTPTVDLEGTADLEVDALKVNTRWTTSTTAWPDIRTWQIRNIPVALGPNLLVVTGHSEEATTLTSASIIVTRYRELHGVPFGTCFEPTEAPPFHLGPLPQNYWTGNGVIQGTTVSEGVQAVGLQGSWTEHEFFSDPADNIVRIETFVRTAGTTEPAGIAAGTGAPAAQVYFSATQGIQALNGDGAGGGTWTNSGVALDPSRFMRVGLRLNYWTQRWDLMVDGTQVLSNLGFAYPKTQLNKFKYYSDVGGALDQVTITTESATASVPTMNFEAPYTRGTTNGVSWSNVSLATEYYLEWSADAAFATSAGNSGWVAGTAFTATGLTDGQLYYYRVKCRNAAHSEGGWSNLVSSTQDASPPATAVSTLPAYETTVSFNVPWSGGDPASGLASARLYYRRNGLGPFQYGGTFTASPIVFNSALTGGDGNYSFWTIGTDNVGNVEAAPATPDAQTTVLTTVPGAPVVPGEPPYTAGLTNPISWAPVTGAAAYWLEWSTNSLFLPLTGNSGWIGPTNFTATNLTHGQSYYYRAKARNLAQVPGPWSNVVSSIQDASVPQSNVVALPPASQGLQLTLNCVATDTVSGLKDVRLYYRRNGVGPYLLWPQPFAGNRVIFNAGTAGGYGPYEFYSIATDQVNNVETAPAKPDATTTLYPTGPTQSRRWTQYR